MNKYELGWARFKEAAARTHGSWGEFLHGRVVDGVWHWRESRMGKCIQMNPTTAYPIDPGPVGDEKNPAISAYMAYLAAHPELGVRPE